MLAPFAAAWAQTAATRPAAPAAPGAPAAEIRPVARVTSPVDERDRTVLRGHVPPAVRNALDTGRLAPQTALNHLVMVLQPAPAQDHALQTMLDQQLDKGSPNFHRWLQPVEFGNRYGVADADIAKVTAWLAAQGFKVEHVANGKRFIQFSGTVAQVESAFRTEMHSFEVNGKAHISNNSDISVPTALRPVIAGVPTLNDFFKKSAFHDMGTLAASAIASAASAAASPVAGAAPSAAPQAPASGKTYLLDPSSIPFDAPAYTNGTTHFVGAGDFAVIYNTVPLLTAGHDGTGVTIGVVGRTDLHLGDIQEYRQFFSLKVNDPTFVVVGEDPGIVAGDDSESYLDVEVSGGAAPGAKVFFFTSRATLTTDGVDLSAMYDVENNLTDIISESYGQCEADFSSASISFYSNLWGEAAAQGQTVFVSSGDNGPASCDSSNSNFSSFGYAVSGLASSPFNVAVGGTLFADTTGGPWWATAATTTPPFTSALGYIPEVPWNEAKASGAVGAAGLWSSSGGISAYITTPAFQRGFGVPVADPAYPDAFKSDPATPFVAGPHRYMPDVAMAAAAQHDGTLYCVEGICQLSSTGAIVDAGIVGGTSVATPTMAGVQALINDFNGGGRQGMVNYVYYALADAQHTAGLNCAATGPPDPNCGFRDVVSGNTLICGNSGCTAATKLGWTAAPGYDLATGLGSPNAASLATFWNTVSFRSTTTTLMASQTTGLTHGQSVTLSGTVAPGSGTGTPTGTVAFIPSAGGLGNPMDPNSGAFLNPVPLATLDGSGNYSIPVTNLPAGTYSLVARYSGDGTFASSTSAPITMTVAQEASAITIAPNAFNGTSCVETPQTTFAYGSYVWTDVTVAGASGQGVPTGNLAITDNGNPLVATILNSNGEGHFLSGTIPTTSCVSGYTFQDAPPLTVGTHVLAASYPGDANFAAGTAAPVTVTITPATVTGALATSATNIAASGTVQFTFTAAGFSGAGPGTLNPTGIVTFTDTTTAATLGTATLAPNTTFGALAVLSTTGISTAGAHSIKATWPGDTNYAGITSAAVTVTVQGGTATSVLVTSNANPAAVGGRPTFTATMTPTTVTSGSVGFYDGTLLLGSGTVGAAHTATFRPAATVSLPAGTHSITANYVGNATFNASTSPVLSQVFNQVATTVTLAAKVAGTYGQQFSMSGTLGLAGTVTPPATGTLQFMDAASPLGSPKSFTIVTAAAGGFGIFEAQMLMSLTAGTHTLTAALTDPNYTAPVSNTQTVTVNQATPTVTGAGGTFTYNGAPHGGTGTATGGLGESLAVTFSYVGTGATTYGPTNTAPSGAGTYQVTTITAGDTNNTSGSSTPAALVILQAHPTVNAVGGTFSYTGNPQGGSGAATGGAGESLTVTLSYSGTGATTYGPSATPPTNVGTYLVTAQTAGNVNNTAGTSTAAALTINKVAATIAVTGYCAAFDNTAHTASGTATGVKSESLTGLVLTDTTHTAVGTYTADGWTFTNANYSNANGTVGDSITDATITVPAHVAPQTNATASVADAGVGATYAWTITGGSITGGAGTPNITFKAGSTGTLSLNVTVTTATTCSATASAEAAIDPIATVPTLGTVGFVLLASLLALAGAAALRARRA
jgi:hypothetical protein